MLELADAFTLERYWSAFSSIWAHKTDNFFPIYIDHGNSVKTIKSLLLKRLIISGVFFRLELLNSVAALFYRSVSIFADFLGASIRP